MDKPYAVSDGACFEKQEQDTLLIESGVCAPKKAVVELRASSVGQK